MYTVAKLDMVQIQHAVYDVFAGRLSSNGYEGVGSGGTQTGEVYASS